jgi:CRP-like cAMP-binding protein
MHPDDLAALPLFADLSAYQLGAVAPLFHAVRLPVEATIFRQNDPARAVYLLLEGEVAIRFEPPDGGCFEIATIRPGGVFGWSAMLERSHYTSAAVTRTPIYALQAGGESLRRVMRADPGMGILLLERMTQVIASRLESFRAQLATLLHPAVPPGS